MLKRPVVLEVPLVLDSFYLISFLQFLLPFSRKRLLLRWIVDIVKEQGRHSKSFMKAVVIFLVLAVKSTLITVPCNENKPRLLVPDVISHLCK